MSPSSESAVRQAAPPLHAIAPAHARSRRAVFVKWLRKTHGWIGLWGAVLGLLFGATGILLNHRAVLKIPAVQTQESTVQLPLPQPAPPDPKAMAAWLAHSLGIAQPASRVKTEPPKPVAWGDTSVTQPARWSGMYASPKSSVQFEYWVGNGFVTVKRSEHNVFATLTNLHKGSGMGIGWVLLADTLAGSIIVLSLSGVLLWAMTTRRRTVGLAIAGVALLASAGLALQAM